MTQGGVRWYNMVGRCRSQRRAVIATPLRKGVIACVVETVSFHCMHSMFALHTDHICEMTALPFQKYAVIS